MYRIPNLAAAQKVNFEMSCGKQKGGLGKMRLLSEKSHGEKRWGKKYILGWGCSGSDAGTVPPGQELLKPVV